MENRALRCQKFWLWPPGINTLLSRASQTSVDRGEPSSSFCVSQAVVEPVREQDLLSSGLNLLIVCFAVQIQIQVQVQV